MESTGSHSPLFQVSEIELSYKSKIKASNRPSITNSKSSYQVLINHWDPGKLEFVEQFKVLLLNRANKVLGIVEISTGGISGTVADLRLIFAAALKGLASSIVLAHNHPSGNLLPSYADLELTRQIKAAGEHLQIKVLDHIIITTEGYYSFADEGHM